MKTNSNAIKATALLPKISLTNFGFPWLHVDEETFEKYCNNLLDFVNNTKINTSYFHINDYSADATGNGVYNYLNPNPPSDMRKDKGTGEIKPWIVTYWLDKLPDEVEAGVVTTVNPGDAWLLDPRNSDGNASIGDGTPGHPKDNMRQSFELIEAINNAADAKKITHMEFDHEGGGAYQEDTPYGGVNGKNVGIGYTKWLWNRFMPSNVTYTDQAASNQSFTGHYNYGFVNYRTEAWASSPGSIEAFAENYWYGELEWAPNKFDFSMDFSTDRDKRLHQFLSTNTITEDLGRDPGKIINENINNQYPNGRIKGGSTGLNWFAFPDLDNIKLQVLAPQNVDTTYRYFRDFPEKLAGMFSDHDYPSGGKPSALHPDMKGWGPPHLDEVYYHPLDPTKQNGDATTPQGGVPLFSIENLSSTNQDRVSNTARLQEIQGVPSDSLIAAAIKELDKNISKPGKVVDSMKDLNSFGGTFDGLSALDYDKFIDFLNAAALEINADDPQSVTLSIYEAPFVPMSWIDQKVPNSWDAQVIKGSSAVDDILRAGKGRQTLMGLGGKDILDAGPGVDLSVGGADSDIFQFKSIDESGIGKKADTIIDYNSSEGDVIDFSSISNHFKYIGSKKFSGKENEVRFKRSKLQVSLQESGIELDMEIKLPGVTKFSKHGLLQRYGLAIPFQDQQIDTIKLSIPHNIKGVKVQNLILGTTGNDSLSGTRKSDVIISRDNSKYLSGGKGKAADIFFLNTDQLGNKYADQITGFNAQQGDLIAVNVETFSNASNVKFKSVGNRKQLNKALGKDFELVYQRNNGKLFINANGPEDSYGDKGGLVATLKGAPKISSNQFTYLEVVRLSDVDLIIPQAEWV